MLHPLLVMAHMWCADPLSVWVVLSQVMAATARRRFLRRAAVDRHDPERLAAVRRVGMFDSGLSDAFRQAIRYIHPAASDGPGPCLEGQAKGCRGMLRFEVPVELMLRCR